MKIFDKVKNNNITPLMCASMCQTQSCFAYENTKNYGLATFLMKSKFTASKRFRIDSTAVSRSFSDNMIAHHLTGEVNRPNRE